MKIKDLMSVIDHSVIVDVRDCEEKTIISFNSYGYPLIDESLLNKEVSSLDFYDDEIRIYIDEEVRSTESMESVTVNFARLYDDVILPSKRSEDAGFDIYPYFKEGFRCIRPHETKMIPTGLKSACDGGYYFQLFERGSTGTKGIAQRCGVIDSGYRGEWFVPITNTTDKPLYILKDGYEITTNAIIYPYEKAICQAVILPVPKVIVKELSVNEIENIASLRGNSCLGSSGK